MIALKVARASGAWPLVVTDVEEQRLEFARDFVPGTLTYRVDAARDLGPERCADEIQFALESEYNPVTLLQHIDLKMLIDPHHCMLALG